MQSPLAGIDGVKGDRHAASCRHQHSVAHGAAQSFAVNSNDLEVVSVEMHRMRHRGPVDEGQLNAFALPDFQRDVRPVHRTVEHPDVARRFGDGNRVPAISSTVR